MISFLIGFLLVIHALGDTLSKDLEKLPQLAELALWVVSTKVLRKNVHL